ncbi:homeobox protein cut-like isoform X2 [Tachypleus tridentatus]|uniref:homeobox protein cut-like isoform X2 n=1 Tax=Tachypleus tridentatus TaxID=6853 RepID=UPI003FD2C0D3
MAKFKKVMVERKMHTSKWLILTDPVTTLQVCQSTHQRAMRSQDLEFENKKLKDKLGDCQRKLKVLKNQDLATNPPRRLSSVQGKKAASVQAQKDLELLIKPGKEISEVHVNVSNKLDEAQRQARELQSALKLSKSEFLNIKSKYDEISHVRSNEMKIFMNDLERANQRATLAEKEASTLKKQIETVKQSLHQTNTIYQDPGMDKTEETISYSSVELGLAAKEKEISQLLRDVQKLHSTINNLKETSLCQIAQLEEMVADKNETIHLLENKLTRQKDYDVMKKQLNMLKMSELSNHHSPENNNSGKEDNKAGEPRDLLLTGENNNSESACKTTHADSFSQRNDNFQLQTEILFPPRLQNVEMFTSLLGEEIVSSYSKLLKKRECYISNPSKTSISPTFTACPQPLNCSKPNHHQDSSRDKVSHCDITTVQNLQECLRICVDKYANETLNTLNISRAIRELLSVHNIGQRQFAKYVLGLSQGTVSELLSKPKPWDKLTEKGKDSYRKMHAWASDDSCVYMLKTLVPRKGKDFELPNCRQDDAVTKGRINQILNEAKQTMLAPTKENKDLTTYNGNLRQSSECEAANGALEKQEEKSENPDREGGNHWPYQNNILYKNHPYIHIARQANDNISHEVIKRIYQEELTKLMGQRMEKGFCFPKDHFESSQEEIRQALTIYYQEIAHLSQLIPHSIAEFAHSGQAADHCPTLPTFLNSTNSHSRYSAALDGATQPIVWRTKVNVDSSTEYEELHHHGSAFSLVRPKPEPSSTSNTPVSYPPGTNSSSSPCGTMVEPSGSVEDLSSSVSPLQRIQSITNSLLTQSTVKNSCHSQRPTKSVIPPITQQQFDQYNNLNTEEIVKHVKDQLSQFSISQRLFGESVLGLSQGSVSDLLARPKPWHMLTQKGREPFVRMKMFLDDENACHKLVASQYKISPEKLIRTRYHLGTGGTTSGPDKVTSQPSGLSISQHLSQQQNHLYFHANHTSSMSMESSGTSPKLSRNSPVTVSTGVTHCSTITHSVSPRKLPHNSRHSSHINPSVYEMAARTTDLDTQSVTSKVKETLLTNNIGQKIFGELVLGLSQGSVSELLSKPKPWHMLSVKGREPFVRMQLWLADLHSVEKLKAIKNDRREANKRKRNGGDALEGSNSCKENAIFSYELPSPSPHSSTKKPRILFSNRQKEALRLAFTMDPYPSTATIEFLASELNLSVRTVTNWFHNYRMRLKHQTAPPGHHNENKPSDMPALRETNTGFDPLQFRFLLNGRIADIDKEKHAVSRPYSMYIHNESDGTLDLSMSSQHFPPGGSSSCSSFQSGPFEATCRSPYGNLTDGMNEDSNFSHDRVVSENSDQESMYEQRSPSPCGQQDGIKETQYTSNSSKRRKPAMPQWVNPELEYSADSDIKSDEDEDDNGEVINGVCVRQAPDINLHSSKSERDVNDVSRIDEETIPERNFWKGKEERCFPNKDQKVNDITNQETNCDSQQSINSFKMVDSRGERE